VRRFPEQAGEQPLRVPHIGWNEVRWQGKHPMQQALPERDVYYFVHGWRALPESAAQLAGTCDYGGPFAAAVAHENVFAVQFHPEKSQSAGKCLLDAFAAWVRHAEAGPRVAVAGPGRGPCTVVEQSPALQERRT
jgi:glutamine amidotransferase